MAINAQGLLNRILGRGTMILGGTFSITGTGAATITGATTVKTAVASATASATTIPSTFASVSSYIGQTVNVVCVALAATANAISTVATNVDIIVLAV